MARRRAEMPSVEAETTAASFMVENLAAEETTTLRQTNRVDK